MNSREFSSPAVEPAIAPIVKPAVVPAVEPAIEPAPRIEAVNDGLTVRGLTVRYHRRDVLVEVSLTIPSGQIACLMGSSGSGKSTLLKAIAGAVPVHQGCIQLAGQDVTLKPLETRGVGMVYQHAALFPHLTAWENIAFGLRVRGLAEPAIRESVARWSSRLRLDNPTLQRRPAELSGGEQQRVAIARAAAIGPTLLLLDEPFSSLDRPTRDSLRLELSVWLREQRITALVATHDHDDAAALGDSVGTLHSGRLIEWRSLAGTRKPLGSEETLP